MQLKRASNGIPITLAEELGSGGEGTVFLVADLPDLVAKIYYEPPAAGKAAKLSAMARLAPPELLRIAAWPTDLLLDESGAVRGFLMRRVSSREDAHELYSPRSRRRAFPDADFRFIVHAAANVARTFAQLHSLGHVIGDVNHGNALIGRDATVVLIDCDSFQVKDGDTRFTCDVGVPLFTPPELQGQNFRGLMRSADHDAFGLAVLLFHLLYVGRHPFAGVFVEGEMPIERAIAESRFAYGANAGAQGVSAPPGTLSLESFGAPIAALFERAFAAPGTMRPTAVEWVDAMNALESDLTTCNASPDHDHPKAAPCCWCDLESRAYIVLFGRVGRRPVPFIDHTELDRLWNEISAVASPPAFTAEHAHHAAVVASKAIRSGGTWRGIWGVGCLLLAWMTCGLFYEGQDEAWIALATLVGSMLFGALVSRASPNKQSREEILRDATARLSNEKYDSTRETLRRDWQRLMTILENPWLAMSEAVAAREVRQREERLQATLLTDPTSPGMRVGEREALSFMGVRSAADVLRERRQLHHALSYAVVRELIQWAENCAAGAVAASAPTLEAHELYAGEEALRTEATRLMTELRGGAELLAGVRDEIVAARQDAREILNSLPPP